MCYPKPGPRCSGHTRPRFEEAREKLRVVRDAQYDTEDACKSAMNAAQQEFYDAYVDFSSTPQGTGEIMKVIQKVQDAGRDASVYEQILDAAQKRRSHQMRAMSISKTSASRVPTESNNPAIRGKVLTMGRHANTQAYEKLIDGKTIEATFKNPSEVNPSRSHPGQWRVTGNGICLVGEPQGDQFRVITLYLDRVVTKPRADQTDAAGRDFKRRYAQNGYHAR